MNVAAPATDDLLYAVTDGIARVTFNRPQARNAMTFAMYEQLAVICEQANTDRSIKVMPVHCSSARRWRLTAA